MSRLPTLRQLHYLNAVIEQKHFGRAATQCFVTQSTLSTGIHELENLLGVKLLERTSRQVIPTRIGLEISERAQHILSLTQDLVITAQAEQNPLSGRIRIGIIPTISPFLLPKSLPTIRNQLPELEIELLEDTSTALLARLHSGNIDLAVLAFPFEIKGLAHAVFAADPFWVALPPEHPLLSEKTIESIQIPENELLLLTEGHCLREHSLQVCQLSSKQQTNIQGTSLYTLIEMVANGLGITLIPEMAVQSEMIRQTGIGLRPLVTNEKTPLREIGLVWRPSYMRTEIIETLSQYFAQALSKH